MQGISPLPLTLVAVEWFDTHARLSINHPTIIAVFLRAKTYIVPLIQILFQHGTMHRLLNYRMRPQHLLHHLLRQEPVTLSHEFPRTMRPHHVVLIMLKLRIYVPVPPVDKTLIAQGHLTWAFIHGESAIGGDGVVADAAVDQSDLSDNLYVLWLFGGDVVAGDEVLNISTTRLDFVLES